jgi:putative spermidine/putrescine transport system permease protein
MSSSSGPEPGAERARLDVAEIEETEGLLEQRLATTEQALGASTSAKRRSGLITAAWAAPGTLWLVFYLAAPVVFIVLTSFWTRTTYGYDQIFTLHNWQNIPSIYWSQLWESAWHSVVIVLACLILGFPVAYLLAIRVQSLRNQIALFIVALAPFWTSYFIRAVAWIPLMGRQGAINTILLKLGIINEPLSILLFSDFAVVLALIQLYILFMITPIFFMLAQVDRSSIESARDLGANPFKVFREVIIPQSMPGIVIGSIFVFVLTMGDYGTVRVIGGSQVSSVGLIVLNQVGAIQFPLAAVSAVILVLAMMLGVFLLLRFSNLREEL